MKGDYQLMLEMINKMRDKETPLPDIVQASEDDQIEQVKVQRGKSGHADWNIVNKKNKVGSIAVEGMGVITLLYVVVWMDCTTLCCGWWVCKCVTSSVNGERM